MHPCTVTREADAESGKLVRQFVRANPFAHTAVIGCYAQMGPDTLAEIEGVDHIVGNQEELNVLDYVREGKDERPLFVRDRVLHDDFSIAAAIDRGTRKTCWRGPARYRAVAHARLS